MKRQETIKYTIAYIIMAIAFIGAILYARYRINLEVESQKAIIEIQRELEMNYYRKSA